ncbi:hypothetical protein UFOVP407_15 [uncultured Caudovirales phage]|uniref:Uncharacterized protein n=1 Tax=uncultured Caudovirales phage TaxID=2100421 RepID=A0A6J5M3A7_9CAUD|nr:hypothetical protein UFOVP407_15 [uncultured Caudovirales phage]
MLETHGIFLFFAVWALLTLAACEWAIQGADHE